MTATIRLPETPQREELILYRVNGVSIESGWKYLTDRAEVRLGRFLKDIPREEVKSKFRKGDSIIIELGYDEKNTVEFKGYITHVSADVPIVLKCEDESWKLKQLPVNISLKNTTLQGFLEHIMPGYTIDALEGLELGPVRFAKTTAAKVLEKLREEYGLYSYFKNDTLVCGKVYADDSEADPIHVLLERQVIRNDLNYQLAEDVLIQIEAVSTISGGKKITVKVGDKEGETRQLSYYGIEAKATLERLAKEDLKKYKVDGFAGGIVCFGVPKAVHGQKVALSSEMYNDRDGIYYVEETRVSFDDQGFRRGIKLGEKAA